MINFQHEMIGRFVTDMTARYEQTYGLDQPEFRTVLGWIGHLALENISNSDALYHNTEHTMMVCLAGQTILRGKHLREGGVRPVDWLQFLIATLCHDIGYVRGVCRNDRIDTYDDGVGGRVEIPAGHTDAALAACHVDRSKLFVRERFSDSSITDLIDIDLICAYIEKTRFNPEDLAEVGDVYAYPTLVRAADFIGQLGDPGYLRKIPALFYEFEEIGANQQMGYATPDAMRRAYAKFFWRVVSPHIQGALHYLNISHEGKEWIASLYSHVFAVEHRSKAQTVKTEEGMIFE